MSSRASPPKAIRPASGRSEPVTPLSTVDLPGSVRSDDGGEAALGDRAAETMHGRMPVVSEGQVLKLESEGHGPPGVEVAQKNPAQIAATTSAAPASRGPAPSGSNRSEGVRRVLMRALPAERRCLRPVASAIHPDAGSSWVELLVPVHAASISAHRARMP